MHTCFLSGDLVPVLVHTHVARQHFDFARRARLSASMALQSLSGKAATSRQYAGLSTLRNV